MPVKVLMLDLGETLVHNGAPFPHVPEALAAFNEMQTAEGKPLAICLVSDFTMPTPPPTPEKIAAIFEEYLGLLMGFGLREFFEPVEQRVRRHRDGVVGRQDERDRASILDRVDIRQRRHRDGGVPGSPAHPLDRGTDADDRAHNLSKPL